MAKPLIDLEVVLRKTGVSQGTADGDALALLLDAVSAEMRRLARREFEGVSGTSYTETFRLAQIDTQPSGLMAGSYGSPRGDGSAYGYMGNFGPDMLVTLRHTPVATITSVRGQLFDGTLDTLWVASQYRLEDARRGSLRMRGYFAFLAEYVQIIYTTTGDIPVEVSLGSADWVGARWAELGREGVASYQTGQDAESYFASLAGVPPSAVARAILGNYHAVGGGVVR